MQLLLYNGVIGTADVPCLTAILHYVQNSYEFLAKPALIAWFSGRIRAHLRLNKTIRFI